MVLTACIGVVLLWLIMAVGLVRIGLVIVTVKYESMAPTFQHGDRVLALRRGFKPFIRKGTIVLLAPYDGEYAHLSSLRSQPLYVKRVVAMGGEHVTLSMLHHEDDEGGSLEPAQKETGELGDQQTWDIPAHHVFVCGDNREGSMDSRQWGPVPLRSIKGVVLTKLRRVSAPRSVAPPIRSAPAMTPMLQPGSLAPDFSASGLTGETITLQAYRGRLLLLLFVTTGLVMRQRAPTYRSFAAALEPLGVSTLLACDADKESVRRFVQAGGPGWIGNAVFDLPLAVLEAYGISMRPAYCLIDERGRVLASGQAMLGDDTWQRELMDIIPRHREAV